MHCAVLAELHSDINLQHNSTLFCMALHFEPLHVTIYCSKLAVLHSAQIAIVQHQKAPNYNNSP